MKLLDFYNRVITLLREGYADNPMYAYEDNMKMKGEITGIEINKGIVIFRFKLLKTDEKKDLKGLKVIDEVINRVPVSKGGLMS